MNTSVPVTPALWREEMAGPGGRAGSQTSSTLQHSLSQAWMEPDTVVTRCPPPPPHARVGMHTHKRMHIYRTHTCIHTLTFMHIHTCILTHMHTHTCTHTEGRKKTRWRTSEERRHPRLALASIHTLMHAHPHLLCTHKILLQFSTHCLFLAIHLSFYTPFPLPLPGPQFLTA